MSCILLIRLTKFLEIRMKIDKSSEALNKSFFILITMMTYFFSFFKDVPLPSLKKIHEDFSNSIN